MAAENQIINGRYQLVEQLGSGGMAVVYKARDLMLDRLVGFKTLRPSYTDNPEFREKFREEARRLANLKHPNIVIVHDVGQDANTYYIVMEFVDGLDLKKHIRSSAPLPLEVALSIAVQISMGVGYAHRTGLVHADIKPQNICMEGRDLKTAIAKVADFGIAQLISNTQMMISGQRQEIVWGSPQYFSPEQASGHQPIPASDVYMIGIVMFEMLSGRLPFVGADQKELALAHLNNPVPHVREFNPNVPDQLDWVIHKCMSKDPAARYREADQLARVLNSYLKSLKDGSSVQVGSSGGNQPSSASKSVSPSQQGSIPALGSRPAPSSSQPGVISIGQPPQSSQSQPNQPSQQPPRESSGPVNPFQLSGAQSPSVPVNPSGLNAPQYGTANSGVVQPPVKPSDEPRYFNPSTAGTLPASGYPQGQTWTAQAQSGNAAGQYVQQGPYAQQAQGVYGQYGQGVQSPYGVEASNPYGNYGLVQPSGQTEPLTIILGVIAFVAVVGVLILWFVVWSAYS